jgi:uncharacterized protein YqeY
MNTSLQIDQDLKAAMLAGDKTKVTILRGLKSAVLYVAVAEGKRDQGLDEAKVIDVLGKEAKKRQDSADMYLKGGAHPQAEAELAEKAIIQAYLPQQLSDSQLAQIVDKVIAQQGAIDSKGLGAVIGAVKQQTSGQADGGRIAALVKERLS